MSLPELMALLPLLILVGGSCLVLMLATCRQERSALFGIGVVTALMAALFAGIGPAPVEVVAGMFSSGGYARFFTILWSLTAAVTLLFSTHWGDEHTFPAGEYTALVLFAAAGMGMLSSAVSLLGFFLGLETFTLVLYILIAFHRNRDAGMEAGLKYLVLGAVATGFIAFATALVYVSAGTFALPDALLALQGEHGLRSLGLFAWSLLLVAIGFKISLVPFHLWTPDVYQGAPAPVSGLLSSGAKGAVLAVLVPMLFTPVGEVLDLLTVLAILSMIVGSLAALRQANVKRMLAFSSVVHMGYAVIALIAGGEAGRSAVVFYVVVYAASNLGAFGILATLARNGEERQTLEDLHGIGYHAPWRTGLMSFFMLSLAGIPLTGGFIGKLGIFMAALDSGLIALAVIGVLASLLSIYYYFLVILSMYTGREEGLDFRAATPPELAALSLCFLATLLLGVLPGPLLELIRNIVS